MTEQRAKEIEKIATESRKNMINHPPYYTKGEIECIDAMRASCTREQFEGYLKCVVIKYLWRFEKKDSRVKDLKKAQWYLDRLIKLEEKYFKEK